MNTADSDSDQSQLLQEPLAGNRNRRNVLQWTLGVALICGLAGALVLWVGPTTSASVHPDGIEDLIRAYAAERGESPLTDRDVLAIRRVMQKTESKRANMRLAKLRSLQDTPELSEACATAIMDMVSDVVKQIAQLAVDYAFECWWGGEDSPGCKDTQEKIDKFDETVVEQCGNGGDICTLTQTHATENKTESEKICIPKECHDELEEATQATAEQIRQKESKIAKAMEGVKEHLGDDQEFGDDVDVHIDC